MSVRSITAVSLLVCLSLAAGAAEVPQGFRLEPVLGGLTDPSALAATPDGRILIAERTTGDVRVVRQGQLLPDPICHVDVKDNGEAGLLGVAVHPAFGANQWIYVYYTDAVTERNRVTRYRVTGTGCDSPLTIFPDLGAGASFIRNGGGITFGPDGKLYVATGDVEDSTQAQNMGMMAGKILRANDNGTIPGDNPTPGSYVYARGVRDPRGVAVNAGGKVYATDAGDDPSSTHAELNVVPAGGNLAWDVNSGDTGGAYDDPLQSWLTPVIDVRGIAVYGASAFPDLAADGHDNDHDAYGPDIFPGIRNVDDNSAGECVGSTNNGLPCNSDSDCLPGRPDYQFGFFTESTRCSMADDDAEWCPGGVPYGDDACGSTGAGGVDEPDESFVNNLFFASGSDNTILRAALSGADLDLDSSSSTFVDSSFLPDCPTGWTDVMTGRDGFLYALADNGGGGGSALYRVIHDGEIGPREVAGVGSHFPLTVHRGATPTEVEVYWEDLRDDAKQPRDNGTDPQPPEREYTVWMGDLGSFYTHAPVPGLQGISGAALNDALRSAGFDAGSGNKYFLVSARSANLEGGLGADSFASPRPGPAQTDLCDGIGYHGSPNFNLWECGQDFTLVDEHGESHSLYEYRGTVLMVDLSAIWCPPCRAEADILENLHDDYKDRGVQVLTVLFDEESNGPNWVGRPVPAECREWSDRAGSSPDHTFPCWTDPLTSSGGRDSWPKYNAWGSVPTNVVLDTGLRVVYSTGGYPESTIRSKLDALVGTTDSCLH